MSAIARRRSRSELSADASDDDEDNFYDANEYQAAHGSSPGAAQTAHTAAASAAATTAATAASNGDATTAAAAEPVESASTTAVAASLADAASATSPSPDSAARSILATKAAFAALRVAPPTPQQTQQTATTAPAGISVDTGSTPQPTGSPGLQPQPSPTNASSSGSSSSASVAPAPSRPPRPSYSVPGSAGTTPQSIVRPLPPGSKNHSPNVTLTGPILPTSARPTSSAVMQTQSALPASATASPHGTREPSASSTTATASSAAASTAAASAAAASASPPPPFTIKNLDTGETCDLQEASSVFPEVNRAMTLEKFEAQAAAAAAAPSASASSATPASTSHASAAGGSAAEPKVSVEEVAEKKKTLGFLSRIKQALHIKDSDTEGGANGGDKAANIIKVKTRHKPHSDFTDLKLIQSLAQHAGPIWTVSVSSMGDYIATGGQDSIVRVWAVMGSTAAREIEEKLRNAAAAQKANQEAQAAAAAAAAAAGGGGAQIEVTAVSGTAAAPAAAASSAGASTTSPLSPSDSASSGSGSGGSSGTPIEVPVFDTENGSGSRPVVYPVCFRSYAGHKADVIDLAWSKANFLLSASIDKTVRLWHVSRQKCLCVFQHADFVTAVAFHPIEDRYFVSGSFDKKLRIWNIPEHRVVEWAQTSNIITAATFNPNGSMTVAGLYNGQAVFYQTDGLKYVTQIDCRNRRGSNRKGKKVTGMQFSPDGKSLLITTNDSRIRLYDMDDYSMLAKFKAGGVLVNDELQIRAWFSQDGKYVICGGENQQVVIWSAAEYHASTAAAAAAAAAAVADGSPISGAAASNGHHHAANGSNASPLSPGAALAANSSTPSAAAAAAAAAAALPRPDVKCDSSESFRAFSDTCTSAQFLPNSTIRLSVGLDDDYTKIKHLIVAAGYQGDLKFFENRGVRKLT